MGGVGELVGELVRLRVDVGLGGGRGAVVSVWGERRGGEGGVVGGGGGQRDLEGGGGRRSSDRGREGGRAGVTEGGGRVQCEGLMGEAGGARSREEG